MSMTTGTRTVHITIFFWQSLLVTGSAVLGYLLTQIWQHHIVRVSQHVLLFVW